jgi:hypothetical protein
MLLGSDIVTQWHGDTLVRRHSGIMITQHCDTDI